MEHIQGNIRLLYLAKASECHAESHRFKPDILQDFQLLPGEDKGAIEQRMEKTEHSMLKYVSYLEWKGYSAAACYIDNARRSMFGNIRRCLK